MSDESYSPTGRTAMKTPSVDNGEFTLSDDDKLIISEVHKQLETYETPVRDQKTEETELAKIDVVHTQKVGTHDRIVINVDDDAYTIQLFDGGAIDPYNRNYFSGVYLNGKQIDVREGGLELCDVSVTIYRTHTGHFIASIWT